MQKSKTAVRRGLTNSCEKKRREKQRRKGKIYPFECRVPKNNKDRDKKGFLTDQCKELEENNRMGKTGDLFKKMRDTKGIERVDGLREEHGNMYITICNIDSQWRFAV